MKLIKPAATIMLARDHDGILEVLLLKRNKALAFAGGLWVFPGGKIEPYEIEQGRDKLEAAKLAAVRETKEEANIDISKDGLVFFRHWTTPVVEPRRYATWFFFGVANQLTLDVRVDDNEIKEHLWVNPQLALEKLKKGELGMMPPTFISLQLIRTCQTVAEAEEKLKQETPIFILPVIHVKKGKIIIMYKGDAGYEASNADLEGARHRLITDLAERTSIFEYSGCDDFLPVNGGDLFFNGSF